MYVLRYTTCMHVCLHVQNTYRDSEMAAEEANSHAIHGSDDLGWELCVCMYVCMSTYIRANGIKVEVCMYVCMRGMTYMAVMTSVGCCVCVCMYERHEAVMTLVGCCVCICMYVGETWHTWQ